MRHVLAAACLAGCAALLLGFTGRWHPAGDSLAVFRTGIALVTLGLLVLLGRRHRLFRPGLAVVLAVLALRVWDDRPGRGSAATLTVYQKNMYFGMRDVTPLANDILANAPDFVTLQEVTTANARLFDLLAADYPARHLCRFAAVGGVAVAARFPVVAGTQRCADRHGLAAMQVMTPDGPVWIVSVHLHWPWPHGQAAQSVRLARILETLDGPMLIGGDFNMVPWSASMRRLMRASGTTRSGPVRPSLRIGRNGPPISIDHVLGSRAGTTTVDLRPRLGSDHRGVLATLAPGGGGAAR